MDSEKKYVFFISSTFKDLVKERTAVMNEVTRLGHFAIGMELFHASSLQTLDYIDSKLQYSDVLISILGVAAGSEAENGKRFIEHEIDSALELGIPVLGFLLDEKDYSSHNPSPEMTELRKKLKDLNQPLSFFPLKDEQKLAEEVRRSVLSEVDNLRTDEQRGFVRATKLFSQKGRKLISKNMSNNPIMDEIIDALENFDELHSSSNKDQVEKRYLSDHFYSMCGANLFADKLVKNIFFEAGSTVDQFAKGLLRLFTEDESFAEGKGNLNVYLNGVVTKFLYDLRRKTVPFLNSVEYLPEPPASLKYGKNLGSLRTVHKIPALQHRESGPREDAVAASDQIVKELNKKIGVSRGLLVMSVSGFDIKMGFSPFTKSYRNFVFKKAAFESEIPKVLIFDGSKWGGTDVNNPAKNLEDGYYHFGTFDAWFEKVDMSPFAVLASTKILRTKNGIIEKFCDAGMRCTPTKRGEYDLLFIYNRRFSEKFGIFGKWETDN